MTTDSHINKGLFALLLTNHRLWGAILLPYIIQNEESNRYYQLSESLSPFPDTDTMGMLSDEEREVVKIINEYNDRNLFKLFSKEKSVKVFTEKSPGDNFEKFIRPFIERRIIKCIKIAKDENIPVYYQKTKSSSLHEEDKLVLSHENAVPVFRFSRNAEQTTYNLTLECGGRFIEMRKTPVDIICMSPCLIRDDHIIMSVPGIDGAKLKPFLTRECITIPGKSELKYFESFVLNAVNDYKVEGTGFEIREVKPEKSALLELNTSLKGSHVLVLQYVYQGKKIYASDPSKSLVLFENKDSGFLFKKYYRDFDWEKRCRDTLGQLGFFSDDDINFFTATVENNRKEDPFSLIEAVNKNFSEIVESGFDISSRLKEKYNLGSITIEITSKVENDWFDLKAIVKTGGYEIPFICFRKNILEGIRQYKLPDGSIAVLPEAWFKNYRNIFEFGTSNNNTLKIHKQHFSLLSDSLHDDGRMAHFKLQKLLKPDQIPEIQPPDGLNCIMRKYQSEGLNWLNYLQISGLGGCLADDMGLGKTIQTLALLQHNKETNLHQDAEEARTELTLFDKRSSVYTSLIIVPASLVYNWENEIRRFVPEMKVYSYKGNQRKKTTSYFSNFDIILSSYHTVRQDVDIIRSFKFHYIILDESQAIKNPASLLYRTITRLNSEFKLVLTGTPVENSLTDLWTQLNFVNPGLLGDLSFFHREFAKPIEKMGDNEKELKLKMIIRPFLLRRTKEMVAKDLPPVVEQTVFCDMTDEQIKLYEEEKSSVRNNILKSIASNGLQKSAIMVLQGLMKLRQISNHPVMTYDDYSHSSGKFETVMQDMENVVNEGHKILVFSSFVKHLELYAEELRRKRIKFSVLTGASTNREKIVTSFQNDPQTRIFLISLKAGGVGLNLTAADYVFILDPWWNPASEMQALSRAHRIGQDKNVFVYRYITSNSIEEKIVRLKEKKSKLADEFITSNNPLKDIDIHDILNIIT